MSAPIEEVDKWFEVRGAYLQQLEIQLNELARHANNLSRKHKELTDVCGEFAASCSLVADCETTADRTLSEAFSRLSGAFSSSASLYRELATEETVRFEEGVRDYVRYIDSVKAVLKQRIDALGAMQNQSRQVLALKDKAKAAAGPVKQKLEMDLANEERTEANKRQTFEQLSKTVRVELERFERTKGREIKELVGKLVQYNMNMELQLVDTWKNFLSMLQRDAPVAV